MNEKKRLMSLYSQLCMELGLNNFNENPNYNLKSLKMDYNSVYGGYRIDTLEGDGHTGEGFFLYSSRYILKEMIPLVQGILHGLSLQKTRQGHPQVITSKTLGELLDNKNETIRRNAMSILKTLQK